MSNPVFVASRETLSNIQKVMDLGFRDDPTVQWYSTLPEVFAAEHHGYVALCADPAFDHGGVHATLDYEGAAIWYPPEVGVSDNDYKRFKETVRFPDRFAGLAEVAEACDVYRPTQPHWTLELIAVDPAAQNKGIGAMLMDFGLAITDQAGLPVFLASSSPANIPFYEKLGFHQIATVTTAPGLTMYPMIRPVPK